MATFVIDWDGVDPAATAAGAADDVNLYGVVNTLSDGAGNSTDVRVVAYNNGVTNPDNPYGNYFYLSNGYSTGTGLPDGVLTTGNATADVTTVVAFDSAVTDISFEIFDIDQSSTGTGVAGAAGAEPWDDQVTIYVTDAAGVPIAANIVIGNTVPGQHTVTTSADNIYTTINSSGASDVAINGSGALDSVSVSIPGNDAAVFRVYIVYSVGPDPTAAATGVIAIGPMTFTDPTPYCFVRGTLIETDRGDVAVEDLQTDDLVRTADNGFQPLRWIGSTTVKAKGHKAPILFRKGAIGNSRDLMLSPEHRVMLQGWQSELMFGQPQLLAAAKSLVNDTTILRQESDTVEYFHILFDQHEIVFSNGAPTESFHPADATDMAHGTREEIYSLFPEFEHNKASYGPPARASLTAHEATLLSL